ncbi:hypothetical protein RHGRI_019841 [Rhododendron griersonianum]|uniref:Uncharacterized protein n=1 Tax=Rhododendron griersonianum TaxID=479676 RepID=A0AAV6JE33_9ERIC|nr:hypothetical protein RHGRI_019841 [Rhododendron griersonianum]
MVNNNNLSFAYDVEDLLIEEGMEVLTKKRKKNLRKINGLLAVNMDRKRIRPDLVLRLQIEERKLKLVDLQARLREEVDQQQQEIMAMPDRPYRNVEFANIVDISLKRAVKALMEDINAQLGEGNLLSGMPLAKFLPRIAQITPILFEEPSNKRFIQIIQNIPKVELFFTLLYANMPIS